jgi:hypothetical protein
LAAQGKPNDHMKIHTLAYLVLIIVALATKNIDTTMLVIGLFAITSFIVDVIDKYQSL